MIKAVNIIGAGNVGTFIAQKLVNRVKIKNIFSYHVENAIMLASEVNAKAADSIKGLTFDVDLNIVCVKDDSIILIAEQLPKDIPVVHTSGSVGIEVFSQFAAYGIIYPLQSFSKEYEYKANDVPFLVESNTEIFTQTIMEFCQLHFSKSCVNASTADRAQFHLAAVIANNFSTYLLAKSKEILEASNLDFKLLEPLMKQTIEKSFKIGPTAALTGPAKRKDVDVIKKQLAAIENEEVKKIYELISNQILKEF